MDISRQGVSPKAGVSPVEASPGQVEGKSGVSVGGKTVYACNPDISPVKDDEVISGSALASSPVGSREAEALSGGLPESKALKPLVLERYSDPRDALESLLDLGILDRLGKGAWGEVFRAIVSDPDPRFLAVKLHSKK